MTIRNNQYASNSSPMMNEIKNQLEKDVGVVPALEWMDECFTALQHREGRVTLEMILEQILFHDLRDVVRDGNTTAEFEMSSNALLLRKTIDLSQTSDCCTQELPSSFRLLLQMEEICDVSKNSESRLTPPDGTSTASSCRKFCCVDGYTPGRSLAAIEISSISATPLLPGIKFLLTGPMTVRHGLMGWQAANVLVLGGQVDRLMQILQQELQKRIQSSGHGMDPTIRALIWKQNDDHLRNEEDEDEHASGDVVAPPPRAPVVSLSVPAQPVQPMNSGTDNRVPNASLASRPEPPQRLPQAFRSTIPSQPVPVLALNPYSTYSRQGAMPLSSPQPEPYRPAPSQPMQNRDAMPTPQSSASASAVWTTEAIEGLSRSEAMTFVQLHSFLNRILHDETEYRQHYNKSFLVGPMQQVGPKIYFNISKRKKDCNHGTSGNEKQYEYVENAKFGHGQENVGLITCRISNTILEPFFSVSATEMKRLTRSDKPKSDILVRESGKLVNQCLYQLGIYEATLEQSLETVFHSNGASLSLDGDTPIICLNVRK